MRPRHNLGRGITARRSLILLMLFLIGHPKSLFPATRTWTGAGGDGFWINPANWNGQVLPMQGDDVLLDQSILGINYTVTLPVTGTIVKSIAIHPDPNQTIVLILPSGNTAEPGLTLAGPGYGLVIDNGAVFQNSSGLTSGESLVIGDSIRINNGGKYIHQTRAAHANNIVRILSSAPGTEKGIFEFDVPRASYTISASNRIYGTLVLSARASSGMVTYACNGSNPLRLNGNLQIEEGASFSVDLGGVNGNIFIRGDYVQNGGIFNLASGIGNSTTVFISGNLIQSVSGQITETNSGLPAIELNGSSFQIISLAGIIANSISLRMNNQEGAILLAPLRLPYKLELIRGKISSSAENLLTLLDHCNIIADTTIFNSSYIDGPLRKEGLNAEDHFLFPVGKGSLFRWLELKNGIGNYTVEYKKENPFITSSLLGPGIDHISTKEYWIVSPDANPNLSTEIELSFVEPASGGVTDLTSLSVAMLTGQIWADAGRSAVTGEAGSNGSVTSLPIGNPDRNQLFTLAGTIKAENPLPLRLVDFYISEENQDGLINTLHWDIDLPEAADSFEILCAREPDDWQIIGVIPAYARDFSYSFNHHPQHNGINYYRLRIMEKDQHSFLSKVLLAGNSEKAAETAGLFPSVVENMTMLEINALNGRSLDIAIVAMDGKIIQRLSCPVNKGRNLIRLDLSGFKRGVYQLVITGRRKDCLRFVKM